MQAAGLSDFRALQALNLIATTALFPAALFAFREMQFAVRTAVIAAILLVFLPNVWFFGGTAFSDVPALAVTLLAIGLLLRGCRSSRAYVGGAVVLAITLGIRPQNLLIGAAPLLVGTWCCLRQRRRLAVAAGAIGAVMIVGIAYGGAAAITGGPRYADAVEMHRQYTAAVDSGREPWNTTFDEFFLRPYRMPWINGAVAIFAMAGFLRAAVRRHRPMLLALATFAPFAVVVWLFLDVLSASRYSIAYAPLIAAATAEGIAAIAAFTRSEAAKRRVEVAVATGLVVLMIVWTAPAVMYARNHRSPTSSAMLWLAGHADPRIQIVYVHETVLPFAWYYLHSYNLRHVHDAFPTPIRTRNAFFVTEGERPEAMATFAWPRGRLWDLVRQRYFVVSVSSTASQIEYGAGWHGPEADARSRWRWMGRRSVTRIRAEPGPGHLRIRFDVPAELLPRAPQVILRWNEREIDRLNVRDASVERTFQLTGPGELVLETNAVMNLRREGRGSDPRDLGLMMREIRWIPAAGR